VCESLAAPQANERKAIDLMFEREMKQEKNLEARERDLRRQRALESENRNKEAQDKKDAKDEKMEALLRKVDADFLAMIKEAEDDESKAAENSPLDGKYMYIYILFHLFSKFYIDIYIFFFL
jgi:dynein intermediate chain 2